MAANTDASTQDRILHTLKTKGPRTAQQLAAPFGVTAMAVRQHLYQLEQQGLVEHHDERKKVGRPARYWRLSAKAQEKFPDSHGELAVGLLRALRGAFGGQGVDKLLRERQKQLLAAYRQKLADCRTLEQRVKALCEIRRAEGYMAEWARQGGVFLLNENHCPICAAAGECQQLCSNELQLFQKALGDTVSVERVDHILSGARRCSYRIAEK